MKWVRVRKACAKLTELTNSTIFQLISSVAVGIILSFLMTLIGVTLPPYAIDNARYFFSAEAQSLAALIAVIFVVHNLTTDKLQANYESLFGTIYPQLLDKYQRTSEVKALLKTTGIIITIALISLVLLDEKTWIGLLAVNVMLVVFAIPKAFEFFTETLTKAGKNHFFEIAEDFLENDVGVDGLFEVFNRIYSFHTGSAHQEYAEDKPRSERLLKACLRGYFRLLRDQSAMGDSKFYKDLNEVLQKVRKCEPIIFYRTDLNNLRRSVNIHTQMCIENGHCVKYLHEVRDMLISLVETDLQEEYSYLTEETLWTFADVYEKIDSLPPKNDAIRYLQSATRSSLKKLAEIIGFHYVADYDCYLDLLKRLKVSKKKRMELLEEVLRNSEERMSNEEHYPLINKDIHLQRIESLRKDIQAMKPKKIAKRKKSVKPRKN